MANQVKDATEYLCSGNLKKRGMCSLSHSFHVYFQASGWNPVNHLRNLLLRYEMQDLHVTETLPQMVALSEAYMQIYEQHE
jgi:hypothetical protein